MKKRISAPRDVEENSRIERENAHLIFDGDGYIGSQRLAPFAMMRYGSARMNDVACELIAVYNVLKRAGRPSPLSVIAQRFIERGGIWRRGHWGTRYWKMPRVLRELGGVRVKRVLFPQFRRSRLEKLRRDNSLILSVVNPGGIRKGIHTFAAFREENGIRFYNSYNRTGTSWLQYPTVRELLSSLRIPFILGAYFVEK